MLVNAFWLPVAFLGGVASFAVVVSSMLVSFGEYEMKKAQRKDAKEKLSDIGAVDAGSKDMKPCPKETPACDAKAARSIVGAVLAGVKAPQKDLAVHSWQDAPAQEKWGDHAVLRDIDVDYEELSIWMQQLCAGGKTAEESLAKIQSTLETLNKRAKSRQKDTARLHRFYVEIAHNYRSFRKGLDKAVQMSNPGGEDSPIDAWWSAVNVNLMHACQQHRLHYQRIEELLPRLRQLQQLQEQCCASLHAQGTTVIKALHDAMSGLQSADKELNRVQNRLQRVRSKQTAEHAEGQDPTATDLAESDGTSRPSLSIQISADHDKATKKIAKRSEEALDEKAGAEGRMTEALRRIEQEIPVIVKEYEDIFANDLEQFSHIFKAFAKNEHRILSNVTMIGRRMVLGTTAAGYTVATTNTPIPVSAESYESTDLASPTSRVPASLRQLDGGYAPFLRALVGHAMGMENAPRLQATTRRGATVQSDSEAQAADQNGNGGEGDRATDRRQNFRSQGRQGHHKRSTSVPPRLRRVAGLSGAERRSPRAFASRMKKLARPASRLLAAGSDEELDPGASSGPPSPVSGDAGASDAHHRTASMERAARSLREESGSEQGEPHFAASISHDGCLADEAEALHFRSGSNSSSTGTSHSFEVAASGSNASLEEHIRLGEDGPSCFDSASQGVPRSGGSSSGRIPRHELEEHGLDMFGDAMAALSSTLPASLPNPLPAGIVENIEMESCVWANSLTGRVYRDAVSSHGFRGWLKDQLQHMINRGALPEWIDELEVSDLSFSSAAPILKNVRWVPTCALGPSADMNYDVAVDAEVIYSGCMAFTVSTRAWMNWPRDKYASIPITISIELNNVSGRMRFGVRRRRSFVAFLEEPFLRFQVHSAFGRTAFIKDLPILEDLIVQRIKSAVRRRLIYPNCKTFRLLWPHAWWPGEDEEVTSPRNEGSSPKESDSDTVDEHKDEVSSTTLYETGVHIMRKVRAVTAREEHRQELVASSSVESQAQAHDPPNDSTRQQRTRWTSMAASIRSVFKGSSVGESRGSQESPDSDLASSGHIHEQDVIGKVTLAAESDTDTSDTDEGFEEGMEKGDETVRVLRWAQHPQWHASLTSRASYRNGWRR